MESAKGEGKSHIKTRAILIILFCVVVLAIMAWTLRGLFIAEPPEIQKFILVSLDDLRADRLGCYGNERNVSPCMDFLASEGTQFLSAFIPFPFTLPSHTSMLTSLYPSVFDTPLDPKIQTLASVLSDHGYQTTAFTADGWMSASYGVLNGFAELDDRVVGLNNLESKTQTWLQQNVGKKFFLFLHTYYVHVPFVAPEKYFREFGDQAYSGPIENNAESTTAFIQDANKGRIAVTPEDRQRLLDIYDGQIRGVDDFLRSLLDTLRQLDLADKTMLIITSDHGEQFFEFKYFGHYSSVRPFADISTRVPLIVYCPLLPRKGKVDCLAEIIDIPPTILEAAKIARPETFQGKSLFPLLRKKRGLPPDKKKEVFFQTDRYAGIRTEKLKLVLDFHSGEKKIYNLVDDPAENGESSPPLPDQEIQALMNRLRIFQENNNGLKEKIGITEVKLAEPGPPSPVTFDGPSLFLAPLDDNSFSYKTRNSFQASRFDAAPAHLLKGRFGKGLLLDPERKVDFPLDVSLSASSGAIEYWLKINEGAPQKQQVFHLDFIGKDNRITVQTSIFWNWGEAIRKRGLIEIKKQPFQGESVKLSTNFTWNEWHHFLIAWEDEEVYLLIDGIVGSRQILDSNLIFEQESTNKIRLSGHNCIIDELRVSQTSRLLHVRPNKIKVDKEVLERLKALGYVGTRQE